MTPVSNAVQSVCLQLERTTEQNVLLKYYYAQMCILHYI
jgi:hypothetical protein